MPAFPPPPPAAETLRKWGENASLPSYTPLLPTIAEQLVRRARRSGGPTTLPCAGARGASAYKLSVFDSVELPPVTLDEYLLHVQRNTRGSSSMWVTLYVLIGRVETIGGVAFTPLRAHRMLLTAALVASKVTDDFGRSNRSYATIGGLQLPELNSLEHAFLKHIDFCTNILGSQWDETVSTLTAVGRGLDLLPDDVAAEPTMSPRLFPGARLLPLQTASPQYAVRSPLSPAERAVFSQQEKAAKKGQPGAPDPALQVLSPEPQGGAGGRAAAPRAATPTARGGLLSCCGPFATAKAEGTADTVG